MTEGERVREGITGADQASRGDWQPIGIGRRSIKISAERGPRSVFSLRSVCRLKAPHRVSVWYEDRGGIRAGGGGGGGGFISVTPLADQLAFSRAHEVRGRGLPVSSQRQEYCVFSYNIRIN